MGDDSLGPVEETPEADQRGRQEGTQIQPMMMTEGLVQGLEVTQGACLGVLGPEPCARAIVSKDPESELSGVGGAWVPLPLPSG